ncbi:hypothetical protein B6N60_00417 [Richelia sinica FACHB-800]|uniref:DUF2267 domain-containing protein n=1 Tax=Richelia sinica FACHB-800 TaxID=1357546 RepID=A0A975T4E1_9NOST|nr:DUF2267 domain-containing protein [Richelia sinica]MBD2662900.1 DUF2267 domain-containing protein [Richelia sinica FACHB-800]QXE21740.1 hypothetical protein B6N60_00417 [Richelia sinica FACHB-800]
MPITIREDVAYILLKKINESGSGMHEVHFTKDDFPGHNITIANFLGHLDYLNQNHYIRAEFTGNAYGNQEDVPDLINPPEFDLRIANTYSAKDGPLSHLITFKQAEITEKGQQLLEKLANNLANAPAENGHKAIDTKNLPFLEKVMAKSGVHDIFDARDLTEVVFRVMRDLMTTEAADRVEAELHKPAETTEDRSLQLEIADLWHDTNPIVAFLSRVRPPWQGPGIFKIDSDRFLFRVENEGPMPPTVERETLVKAVFSATKDELSPDRIAEIATWLPDHIHQLWQEA